MISSLSARQAAQRQLTLADLEDEAKLDEFIERAMTLRPPEIVSSYVTDLEKQITTQLQTKVRGRLLKLSEQIAKQVAIEKRLAKTQPPKSVDAASSTQHGASPPSAFRVTLSQRKKQA